MTEAKPEQTDEQLAEQLMAEDAAAQDQPKG